MSNHVNPKSASILILYTALLDWLTLTSFDDNFLEFWRDHARKHGLNGVDKYWKQYDGEHFEWPTGGSIFVGAGMQKGVYHYIVRISGYAAEDLKSYAYSQYRQGIATCTRVDLQVTIPMPKKWSQWELLTRLHDAGKKTNWYESKSFGDAFMTVYVGARSSDRFTRIYMKKADENMLLRLETEYKSKRSHAIMKELCQGVSPSVYLTFELQKSLGDMQLRQIFEPCLNGAKPHSVRLQISTSLEKQEAWLLGQVLPAFTRHINDHNTSGRVLLAFTEAINDAFEK